MTAVGAASAESLTGVPLSSIGDADATIASLDRTLADGADAGEIDQWRSMLVNDRDEFGRQLRHIQRDPHDRRLQRRASGVQAQYVGYDEQGRRFRVPISYEQGFLIASESPLKPDDRRPPEPWRFVMPSNRLLQPDLGTHVRSLIDRKRQEAARAVQSQRQARLPDQ
ncbi:MAG: hypothetical protein ACOCXA_02210 [Planctomycetota bacterium]